MGQKINAHWIGSLTGVLNVWISVYVFMSEKFLKLTIKTLKILNVKVGGGGVVCDIAEDEGRSKFRQGLICQGDQMGIKQNY